MAATEVDAWLQQRGLYSESIAQHLRELGVTMVQFLYGVEESDLGGIAPIPRRMLWRQIKADASGRSGAQSAWSGDAAGVDVRAPDPQVPAADADAAAAAASTLAGGAIAAHSALPPRPPTLSAAGARERDDASAEGGRTQPPPGLRVGDTIAAADLDAACAEVRRRGLAHGLVYVKNGKAASQKTVVTDGGEKRRVYEDTVRDGAIQRFKCQRAGKPEVTRDGIVVTTSRKCNCTSVIYTRVTMRDSGVSLEVFESREHNHALASEQEQESQPAFTHDAVYALIDRAALRKEIALQSRLGNSPAHMRKYLHAKLGMHVPDDLVRSVLDQEKRALKTYGDARGLQDYMANLKATGGYARSLPNGMEIGTEVWATPQMLENLQLFGDVVVLDTTSKTNVFGLPLFFAVVVDGNGRTRLGMAGIMRDESSVSFNFVFNCVKEVVDGAGTHVHSIVSDADLAIIAEVESVFPDAAHILCQYHLFENVRKNLAQPLGRARYESFFAKFRATLQAPSVPLFERAWAALKSEFEPAAQYMERQLEKHKAKFAHAYLRLVFRMGTRASQRVESINNAFGSKAGITAKTSLTGLVGAVEGKLRDLEKKIEINAHESKQKALFAARLRAGLPPFGAVYAEAARCLQPWAQRHLGEQMDLAASYSVEKCGSLAEAVARLERVQAARLLDRGLRLDVAGDESGEDGAEGLGGSERLDGAMLQLRASEAEAVLDVYAVNYEYSDALQVLVFFEHGGYFCSCGFPANFGLPCRHVLRAWAMEPGIFLHLGLHAHPRYSAAGDGGEPAEHGIFSFAKLLPSPKNLTGAAPPAELLRAIGARRSLWRCAQLVGVSGLEADELPGNRVGAKVAGLDEHDARLASRASARRFNDSVAFAKKVASRAQKSDYDDPRSPVHLLRVAVEMLEAGCKLWAPAEEIKRMSGALQAGSGPALRPSDALNRAPPAAVILKDPSLRPGKGRRAEKRIRAAGELKNPKRAKKTAAAPRASSRRQGAATQ